MVSEDDLSRGDNRCQSGSKAPGDGLRQRPAQRSRQYTDRDRDTWPMRAETRGAPSENRLSLVLESALTHCLPELKA